MSDNEKSTQTEEPNFRYNAALAQDIENKWQKIWDKQGTFWAANVNGDLKDGKGRNAEGRTAYFAMDMFPYPSGKGLHVGHPLGYLASDVVSRYHRMKGENVLHAMGYDAFGLPAEQYAVQTGQHPRVTTEANIANMSRQLHRMGLSFDNRRTFATIDPGYVRWTQWIFSRIYDSWYDEDATNPSGSKGSARPIAELVAKFESGEKAIPGHESDGKQWSDLTDAEQQDILNDFRLAYISKSPVNWCPGLGTVLANEEVTAEGKSERGNFPVFQRELRQWSMRITKYGHRLIADLDGINWPEKVKLMQRNWIGESHGASVHFTVATADGDKDMEIYTTRPDTLFGTTFAVVSPEHHLLENVPAEWPADVPEDWKGGYANPVEAVKAYRLAAEAKTAKDRVDEAGEKTGLFTGLYATNPITGAKLPLFTADYVLMDYGTGAIMAVPGGDQRDYDFAVKFGLPVIYTVTPLPDSGDDLANYEGKAPFVSHDGIVINSSVEATEAKGDALSLNGLRVDDAIAKVNAWLESAGVGKGTVSYRLRDWLFSRQRYWGEPFPIYYKDDTACPLREEQLPLELPPVADFGPTAEGEPPLARVKGWCTAEGYPYELSTMPGFAGSSAYYLRYMDPHNDRALVGREADEYWRSVDLYVGGIEHATGHLMYSRFWNMFLYDLGYVCEEEPFRKLVNQGMIQGRSNFVYRVVGTNKFVSLGLRDRYETQQIHVDVNIVRNDVLDLEAFRAWRPEFRDAEFILEDGKYVCGWAIEKMSKSMYNVVNPDYIVENYGADTLRMYEMFLGPLEQSKPWDTNGIDGVHKFLRRFWRLFFDRDGQFRLTDEPATEKELRTLHKTIRKVTEDIENFSFNTSVAAFMICLNELGDCSKRAVLEPLVVLLAPFAPHIAEELWAQAGHTTSVCDATYPVCEEKYLVQSAFEYPVSVNGKLRFKKEYATTMTPAEIQAAVVTAPEAQKWLDGKAPKKVIVVPGKIINIVI